MSLKVWSFLGFTLLTAGPLSAQEPDFLALGRARAEARDPYAAYQHFRSALARDPESYEARWRAALALLDVAKQTPDSVASPRRDSMYAEAERHARRATELAPGDAEGHFVLASAVGRASLTKSKRERVSRAIEIRNEALRAVELDPGHHGAWHVLGRWHAEIMRLSAIERFFARRFLGGRDFDQASWDRATEFMEKAVALGPATIYHRLGLAEVYIDRKRYREAREQLERIATLPVVDVMDPEYQRQAVRLLRSLRGRD